MTKQELTDRMKRSIQNKTVYVDLNSIKTAQIVQLVNLGYRVIYKKSDPWNSK